MGHVTDWKEETKDLPEFFNAKAIMILTKTLVNEKEIATHFLN